MYLGHWGVLVVVEGGFDEQRGATFPHANSTRVAMTARRPIPSSRVRPMAVVNESNTATSGGLDDKPVARALRAPDRRHRCALPATAP